MHLTQSKLKVVRVDLRYKLRRILRAKNRPHILPVSSRHSARIQDTLPNARLTCRKSTGGNIHRANVYSTSVARPRDRVFGNRPLHAVSVAKKKVAHAALKLGINTTDPLTLNPAACQLVCQVTHVNRIADLIKGICQPGDKLHCAHLLTNTRPQLRRHSVSIHAEAINNGLHALNARWQAVRHVGDKRRSLPAKLTTKLLSHAALKLLLLRFCKHKVYSAVGAAKNVHLLFKRHALHGAVKIQTA